MDKQQEYLDRLPKLLLNYQFIEEILKMYIWRADVIIHSNMKGKIDYRGLNTTKLSKLPLGGLIEEFKRRTERNDLIVFLQEVQGERNFFAHKGYLLAHEEEKKEKEAEEFLKRLEYGLKKSESCLKMLIEESCKISGETVPEMLKEMG